MRLAIAVLASSLVASSAFLFPRPRGVRADRARMAVKTEKMAQYLLDLHDGRAVFDFCGGMMCQLVPHMVHSHSVLLPSVHC